MPAKATVPATDSLDAPKTHPCRLERTAILPGCGKACLHTEGMMEVAEVMAQSRNYRMKRRDGRGIQEVSSNSCSMSWRRLFAACRTCRRWR